MLKAKACKDDFLLSNLDVAERIFRHSPLSTAITLQVKGQWQCVRIGIDDNVIYTVSSEGSQARIDCCVSCSDDKVTSEDIKSIHFSVHSCQNEIRSCFTEAKGAVSSKPLALKITCNRFSITYVTLNVPDEMKMIETKCQFKLYSMTAEELLKRKCWMEKEKANCQELIACLDYLIQKYLTVPEAPKYNCRFVLQGNKEMAEIISQGSTNQLMKEYVLMSGKYANISMYPSLG